jgi:uncharacterized protein (DUF58 family)
MGNPIQPVPTRPPFGRDSTRRFKGPRSLWNRIRAWRRIQVTRAGGVFTLGSFAVGFAAFNTGNNLLYLLFGAMLGVIVVSGWLSEQVIRNLDVIRMAPRGVTAGNPVRIQYQVRNRRLRIPSFTLEIGESRLPGRGFIPILPPGGHASAKTENRLDRRGIFPLKAVTISTSFPFGLFRKSRDLPLGGELVIWPRSDRQVRPPNPGGGRTPRTGALSRGSAGPRGEYRGLRSYRPGDDPRDIHWRTTARLGRPVIREYEQGQAEALWICLDTRGEPGDRAEETIEIAASLASRAFREGRRFGLACRDVIVEAGLGPGQQERVLGALARVVFEPHGQAPRPPVSPSQCVLVTMAPGGQSGFGDIYATPQSPGKGPSK